ncbi:conserved Plasmodium protein, unknown function [Plasmodium sp. gorilla clade G2]|uniref:conserved Plasmodium protein, unknown function n=1 Tax=Plasmodium sp. gorilla clade G2 TaxID=880535 RepID=UPI000D21C5AE|nr:conserved Plasmodium protein, unknown function [Plasmodium sp. gorilla clade G2]SOV10624.1 conserved Plasmodium protein, unknown function [Plasmodium sp. gorilla clade G2]
MSFVLQTFKNLSRVKLKIKRKREYEKNLNNLSNLSNHTKLIRIDINGKVKKCSRYFFNKDKYIYINNIEDMKRFDQTNNKNKENKKYKKYKKYIQNIQNNYNNNNYSDTFHIHCKYQDTNQTINKNNIICIDKIKNEHPNCKKKRKVEEKYKNFINTYNLSEEEIIYMRFIHKIKIKNIFALINNIRKNIYINKYQANIILNCIYKYLSIHCHTLSKEEFFFFLYIFPQDIKYSSKVLSYLINLLQYGNKKNGSIQNILYNNNKSLFKCLTINECIDLICEINLYYLNISIKNIYIDYLNKYIKDIKIQHIFQLFTDGSYLFLLTDDDIHMNHSHTHNSFLKNIKSYITSDDFIIHINDKILNGYIKFLSYYLSNNIYYLHILFKDLYITLHKKILINNYHILIKHYKNTTDYIIHITNKNEILNYLNTIFLNNYHSFYNQKDKNLNVKVKIFSSHLNYKQHDTHINVNDQSHKQENKKCNTYDDVYQYMDSINKKIIINHNEYITTTDNTQNYYHPNLFSSQRDEDTNVNDILYDDHKKKENYQYEKNKSYDIIQDDYIRQDMQQETKKKKKKNIKMCDDISLYMKEKEKSFFIINYKHEKDKTDIHSYHNNKFLNNKIRNLQNNNFNTNKNIPLLYDKEKLFLFTYAYDKIQTYTYEELKLKYNISTKIVDKNIKMFLKFLKNCHNNENTYVDNIISKKNIFQLLASMKNNLINKINCHKYLNDFIYSWCHIKNAYQNDRKLFLNSNMNEQWSLENNIRHDIIQMDDKIEDINILRNNNISLNNNNISYNHLHNNNNNDETYLIDKNHSIHDIYYLEDKEYFLNLINNIYNNKYYDNTFFYTCQINSLSKGLYYFLNYYIYVISTNKEINKKNNMYDNNNMNSVNLFINNFINTFYEMVTYLLKNLYKIHISKFFYIFLALSKFFSINSYKLNNSNKKQNFMHMENILYILYLIRKNKYEHVKSILYDKCNENYFTFNENKNYKLENASVLYNIILNKFSIEDNDELIIWHKTNENDNKKVVDNINNMNNINNTYKTHHCNNKNIFDKKEDTHCLHNNLYNSLNFLIMFLNNYLDNTKNFKISHFLITLYYINKIIPSNMKHMYHLETYLNKKYTNYKNRFFYIYNGLELLKKSYAIQIKKLYIQSNNNIYNICNIYNTYNICNIYKYNIYDNIDNIFIKNKNIFCYTNHLSLLYFTYIYSMNRFYYSTLYYNISKYFYYKINIDNINFKDKIILFFILIQCKYIYHNFFNLLLQNILSSYEIKKVEKLSLYIISNIILLLIKNSNMKLNIKKIKNKKNYKCIFSNDIYNNNHLLNNSFIHKKLSSIQWKYIFPMDLFISQNLSHQTQLIISKFEENIVNIDNNHNYKDNDNIKKNQVYIKYKKNQVCIKTSTINLNKFKNELFTHIPLLMSQYKKYIKRNDKNNTINNKEQINNQNNHLISHTFNNIESSFIFFDDNIEQEIFNLSQKFLSYDYVTTHFNISNKSLYYDLLVYLKCENF